MVYDVTPELSGLWWQAEDHVRHGRFGGAIQIYEYILWPASRN